MADGAFTLTSSLFQPDGELPLRMAHSMAGGEDVSPDLAWTGAPEGTRSFALTCWDPDAPTGVGFVHWVLFDIPGSATSLPAGGVPAGATAGFTDWGVSAWGGMAPPPGDAPHRYVFTLYALSAERLGLPPTTTYALLRFMIRQQTLATAELVGRFGLPAS